MAVNYRNPIYWLPMVVCLAQCNAFWLGSSSEPANPPPPPQQHPMPMYAYQSRFMTPSYHQAQDTDQAPMPVAVPSIPVQVPLKAQLQPIPNIHNVQLVPCICPVSAEDALKPNDGIYTLRDGSAVQLINANN